LDAQGPLPSPFTFSRPSFPPPPPHLSGRPDDWRQLHGQLSKGWCGDSETDDSPEPGRPRGAWAAAAAGGRSPAPLSPPLRAAAAGELPQSPNLRRPGRAVVATSPRASPTAAAAAAAASPLGQPGSGSPLGGGAGPRHPGGARRVTIAASAGSGNGGGGGNSSSGPPAEGGQAQPARIFPRVDDAQIISGIQEACGAVKVPPRTAVPRHPLQTPPDTPGSRASGDGGGGGGGGGGGAPRRSPAPPVSKSKSLPAMRAGGEPRGAPEAGGGAREEGQQQQQQPRRSGAITVEALREDLKHVVHLYPPGRVLWILSDELVGPAANQLVQAVSAHLPPSSGGGTGGSGACAEEGGDAGPRPPGLRGAHPVEPAADAAGVRAAAAAEAAAVEGAAASGAARATAVAARAKAADEDRRAAAAAAPGAPAAAEVGESTSRAGSGSGTGSGLGATVGAATSLLSSWLPFLSNNQQLPGAEQQQPQPQQQQAGCPRSGQPQQQQPQPQAQKQQPAAAGKQGQQQAQAAGPGGAEAAREGALSPRSLRRSKSSPAPRSSDHQAGGGGAAAFEDFASSGSGNEGSSGSEGGAGAGGGGAGPAASEADADEERRLLACPPPELAQLLALVGTPTDAGSALAIAHKRTLLVRHFAEQRRAAARARRREGARELQPLPGEAHGGEAVGSGGAAGAAGAAAAPAVPRVVSACAALAVAAPGPAASAAGASAPEVTSPRLTAPPQAELEEGPPAGLSPHGPAGSAGGSGAAASPRELDPDKMSLQEMAKKSLLELSLLPERIAESLSAWRAGLDAAAAAGAACAPPPAAPGARDGGGGDSVNGSASGRCAPRGLAAKRALLVPHRGRPPSPPSPCCPPPHAPLPPVPCPTSIPQGPRRRHPRARGLLPPAAAPQRHPGPHPGRLHRCPAAAAAAARRAARSGRGAAARRAAAAGAGAAADGLAPPAHCPALPQAAGAARRSPATAPGCTRQPQQPPHPTTNEATCYS
jgi:hypothetical protein